MIVMIDSFLNCYIYDYRGYVIQDVLVLGLLLYIIKVFIFVIDLFGFEIDLRIYIQG